MCTQRNVWKSKTKQNKKTHLCSLEYTKQIHLLTFFCASVADFTSSGKTYLPSSGPVCLCKWRVNFVQVGVSRQHWLASGGVIYFYIPLKNKIKKNHLLAYSDFSDEVAEKSTYTYFSKKNILVPLNNLLIWQFWKRFREHIRSQQLT